MKQIKFSAALMIAFLFLASRPCFSMETVDIVEELGPSIVFLYGEDERGNTWSGSGMVVGSDGRILTNYHVVAGSTSIYVKFQNGDEYQATEILSYNENPDLAIIRIDARGLKPAKLGDSEGVRVGEDVIALGNPEGLEFSVSRGIISAKRDMGDGYPAFQTDATISFGSSGGALVNKNAEVIGITTYIITAESGADLNFAIPINLAKSMISDDQSISLQDFGNRTSEDKNEDFGDMFNYLDKNQGDEAAPLPFFNKRDRGIEGVPPNAYEELAEIIGRYDFVNGVLFTWWTDEMWALMAIEDPSTDTVMAMHVMKIISKQYLIFAALPLEGAAAGFSGTPVLTNDRGVTVEAAEVHPSLKKELGDMNLLIFPQRDVNGRPLVDPRTSELTVSVRYSDSRIVKRYSYALPLAYPDVVNEAVQWAQQQGTGDYANMPQDEAMFIYMAPWLRIDLSTGIIAMPINKNFMELLGATEDMSGVMSEFNVFVLVSMDPESDLRRLKQIARTARAVNTSGRNVQPDDSGADMGESEGVVLFFPKLGNFGTYQLILEDPDTGKEVIFEWEVEK